MNSQGKNSQRELKTQLSEKGSAAVLALVRIAATLSNEGGSEVRLFDRMPCSIERRLKLSC